MTRVAALYVDPHGVYADLPDVDLWDEARDARLYDGPWPVVAHPPCNRWSVMATCRRQRDGNDGGCFAAALEAVRMYGGVLEHPRYSLAWQRFGLARPARYGWTQNIGDPGWTAEIDQSRYGHPMHKPTWIYFVGDDPPPLRWHDNGAAPRSLSNRHGWGNGQRSRTPPAFRDELLSLAAVPRGSPLAAGVPARSPQDAREALHAP